MRLWFKYEMLSSIAGKQYKIQVHTHTQSAAMPLLIYKQFVLDVCPTVTVIDVSLTHREESQLTDTQTPTHTHTHLCDE